MIDYVGIARKAVECADMVKLLEGKGEYRCEFYYYGFPPDADVTDWNNLISREFMHCITRVGMTVFRI